MSPPPFDLPASYGDSVNTTPLVFLLSPGSDPTGALQKYAGEKGKVRASFHSICKNKGRESTPSCPVKKTNIGENNRR